MVKHGTIYQWKQYKIHPTAGDTQGNNGKVNLQQAVTPWVNTLKETRADLSIVIGETHDYCHIHKCLHRDT